MLVFVWTYLVSLVWGWGGLVLGMLGVLDAIDWFRDKPLLLARRHKVTLAIAALFVSQFMAYKGLSDDFAAKNAELVRVRAERDETARSLREKDTTIANLRSQLNNKAALSDTAGEKQRLVRDQLSQFVAQGIQLRNEWISELKNPSNEPQSQTAAKVVAWHSRIKTYLVKPPLGMSYAVRFDSQTKGSNTIPEGIFLEVAGGWTMLGSDLATLNEFIADSNIAK